MKLSFIIPIYNAESWIEDCIVSILNQKLNDIEIILVDDGSTDNSKVVCKQYTAINENIRYLYQNNKKQGAARNYGLKEATGEYILFVDADDKVLSANYDEIYKFAKNNAIEVLGLSQGKVLLNDMTTQIIENLSLQCPEREVFSGKEYVNKYGYNVQPMPWMYLYEKNYLIENNIWFLENVFHEDCDFCLKTIVLSKRLSLISSKHYCQRLSENSTMRSKNKKKCLDLIEVSDAIRSFVDNLKTWSAKEKRNLYHYSSWLAFASIKSCVLQGYYLHEIPEVFNQNKILICLSYDYRYLLLKFLLKAKIFYPIEVLLKIGSKRL